LVPFRIRKPANDWADDAEAAGSGFVLTGARKSGDLMNSPDMSS
jgi:hypothetical protein